MYMVLRSVTISAVLLVTSCASEWYEFISVDSREADPIDVELEAKRRAIIQSIIHDRVVIHERWCLYCDEFWDPGCSYCNYSCEPLE
jgi:hypothetical protein